MAYMGLSRGREEFSIYTNNMEEFSQENWLSDERDKNIERTDEFAAKNAKKSPQKKSRQDITILRAKMSILVSPTWHILIQKIMRMSANM